MDYSVSEQDDIVIISLNGKIMGGPEATEINEKFNQLIDTKKLKIVIDLKNVEWMNSSGLGILIGAVSLFRNNNGQLRIINVSERIQNLLKITKLAGIFETSSSLEEALSSFKN
ncbi:MAG: STAS domain-containing protein [Calditrichia bacterium]|jgi:anti-sigma B factor antagonist|nr:STAS domain-containing protein [Calditrichia bacterium]